MTIRVVLVDDQTLVRTGFRMIIEATDDIEVVGEAGNGTDALALVEQTDPDIVLMDIRMDGMGGIEATKHLRAACGERPKVIILTTFDLDEYVFAGLQAGASGFLLKDTLAADLIAAIRVVASGEAVAAPSVTRRLIASFVAAKPAQPQHERHSERLSALTPREREVLTLITRGMSNGEIAAALHLSEGTVKIHVGRVLGKLGLRDRVHAVVLGFECGLVPVADPADSSNVD